MKRILIAALVAPAVVTAPPADPPVVVAQFSMACGFAPIPAIGCRVGACVCDANGQNCVWTFVCG